MPSPAKPTSPDDPEWVEAIVARALERSGATPKAPATSLTTGDDRETAVPESGVTTQFVSPTSRGAEAGPSGRAPDPVPPVVATATAPIREPVAAPAATVPSGTAVPSVDGADDLFIPDEPPATSPEPTEREPTIVSAPTQGTWDDVETDVITPYPDDALFTKALGDPDDGATPVVSHRLRSFLEWGAVIVGALAVALLIKTFLMQAYYIPSGSMEPTLEIGDRLLVNKLSYNFGDVGRGDLIVFRRPPGQTQGEDDLIKRVIALGGETIEIRDGEVFIRTVGNTAVQRLVEPYLPDGVTTAGFFNTDNCASATATSCEVPDGSVFVMGDNRGGSRDSRVFGPIDDDLVVGRAFLRVWPLGEISFL